MCSWIDYAHNEMSLRNLLETYENSNLSKADRDFWMRRKPACFETVSDGETAGRLA